MIYILAFLVVAVIASVIITGLEDHTDSKAWDEYKRNETSQAQLILSRAARPLANIPALQRQISSTRTYRQLEMKLRAGGAYGGSLEVYLAFQMLGILIFIALLGVVFFTSVSGLLMYICLGFAGVLLIYPYNQVVSKASERAAAVTDSLPDFAELLIMVLPNSSILSGLAFTAERTTGPVSDEIKGMVGAISSRTLNETEAFQLTAERLGTPEAKAFITTLMNAYIDGTKALDAIVAQAEAMRKIAFQRRREAAKKLPTKLIVLFGMHFMPALFVIIFIPLVFGIGDVIGGA